MLDVPDGFTAVDRDTGVGWDIDTNGDIDAVVESPILDAPDAFPAVGCTTGVD